MICQKAQGTISLLLKMLCPWEAFWIFLAYFHTLFCSRAHAMQWGIFICHQNVLWDILPSSLLLLNFLLLHIAKKKIDYVLSYLHSHLGHIEHLCMLILFRLMLSSDWKLSSYLYFSHMERQQLTSKATSLSSCERGHHHFCMLTDC